MSALADGSVRSRIHVPLEIVIVRRIKHLVAEINLIEATLRRNFHHKVSLVR